MGELQENAVTVAAGQQGSSDLDASEKLLKEADTLLPAWVARLVNDRRDLPFIRLMLQCSSMMLAGVGLFFVPEAYFWPAAAAYWLLGAVWIVDRFILMLHCTSHRQLFKPKHRWLNRIIPWFIGPFVGEVPESYFVHHMGMHHREENLPDDLSSTMSYQRDRFSHWLHYTGKFLLWGVPLLARYHRRRSNLKLLRRLLVAESVFWGAVALLLLVHWQATLVVFVAPVVVVRVLMMTGNWAQHAFVDAADPSNPYRSSITCIDCRYNRRCFNDGYHIHHHVQARCHWSDYPSEFQRNIREYGRQDAIVFEGLDFFSVWALLMLGRWQRLARAFVQLPEAPCRTEDEVIAFLKGRVAAIR